MGEVATESKINPGPSPGARQGAIRQDTETKNKTKPKAYTNIIADTKIEAKNRDQGWRSSPRPRPVKQSPIKDLAWFWRLRGLWVFVLGLGLGVGGWCSGVRCSSWTFVGGLRILDLDLELPTYTGYSRGADMDMTDNFLKKKKRFLL
jgi:hypothetical protein